MPSTDEPAVRGAGGSTNQGHHRTSSDGLLEGAARSIVKSDEQGDLMPKKGGHECETPR
jgi:hypothetical protein